MPKLLPNLKEDICRTTRQMMAQEGYASIGIRSIASRCGIGMGTIYNYFSSKEEIIAEILLEDWNVILRRMDQANRTHTLPMERLAAQFVLLQEFLGVYHGPWIRQGMNQDDKAALAKHHYKRVDYQQHMAERIAAGMVPEKVSGAHVEDTLFYADLIARLFFSYAPQAGFLFSRIAPTIEAILLLCHSSSEVGI